MNRQDYFSEFQKWRHQFTPQIPSIYSEEGILTIKKHPVNVDEKIAAIFPTLYADKPSYVELLMTPVTEEKINSPLRIGILLSGGQAAGGHNVISGLYDFVKKHHSNSQLFGFIGGSIGVYKNNYVEINESFMDQYRNQGGFDMICSGRNKIETVDQYEKCLLYCSTLKLDGLVVVGGDDSNTNACLLAEFFLKHECPVKVIGVPKTIDGDLKNQWIETSFGFDTATRIYSEMIGNVCTDVLSSKKYYTFVRLMGRNASHVAMECCLLTQINWVVLGEEVERKNQSFKEIVSDVCDIICKRSNIGKNYGVIIVPEGLVEFVTEFKVLIAELNELLPHIQAEANLRTIVLERLTENSKALFKSLPRMVADPLLLERDPHGNVQLSRIETEKYLISQIAIELEHRREAGNFKGVFAARNHFFGYEGQSALPSNFDSEYCYKLGYNAGGLVSLGLSGYMSIIRGLEQSDPQKWTPAGCPLMTMMNIERRMGKDVSVIKKALLEMDDERFIYYQKVRDTWALNDCYRNPGPIQYSGPLAVSCSFLIKAPDHTNINLAEFCNNQGQFPTDLLPWAPKTKTNISPFSESIAKLELLLPKLVSDGEFKIKISSLETKFCSEEVRKECEIGYSHIYNSSNSNRLAEIIDTAESFKLCPGETLLKCKNKELRIAIVYSGRQAPGGNNVVNGLLEFQKAMKKRFDVILIGFLGGNIGMTEGKYIYINECNFSMYRNTGGYEFLGRSSEKLRTNEDLAATLKVVTDLDLDGLLMVGASHTMTDALLLSNYFLSKQCKTSVMAVPVTIAKNVCHPTLLEAVVGFDTTSKVYSHLIGNIMTDCSSTPKFWYIIKLMGREPSHLVLECALQTHPNCVIISEDVAQRQLNIDDIVNNICDIVVKRHNENKNFGTVLIPEGILLHLPLFSALIEELNGVLRKNGYEHHFINKLLNDDAFLRKYLSPWNVAKFNTLPEFTKVQLLSRRDQQGNFNMSELETEKLFAFLIHEELERRKAEGRYDGVFTSITHSFGILQNNKFKSIKIKN